MISRARCSWNDGACAVAFCLLSAGIFRGSMPLKDVLAIGVLALSACAYEGLEEVLLVGFTQMEVSCLSDLVDELFLSPERAANQEAFLVRMPPALRELHQECVANCGARPDPIAWAAAAAR